MIYFLEDDNNIRNFVTYALNNTGLEAQGFDHPDKFWEAMTSGSSASGYYAARRGWNINPQETQKQ